MWTQHNPRVPLGVTFMISKGSYWQISNIIIKFVLRAFLYLDRCCLNPTVVVVLNQHYPSFYKCVRENRIGAKNRSCIWATLAHWEILWQTQNLLNTFKPVCSCSFQHLEVNFKNLLGMESTSDLTLQLLSSVNNDLFFLGFFSL